MKTTSKFVAAKIALKEAKTKKDYIQSCLKKGLRAVYSGKEKTDKEGEVVRKKGFYVTPLSTGRDASALRQSN